MSGLGIIGDSRIVSFTGRVTRYDTQNDVVIQGAMSECSIYISDDKREHFRVDTECLITVATLETRIGTPTKDAT